MEKSKVSNRSFIWGVVAISCLFLSFIFTWSTVETVTTVAGLASSGVKEFLHIYKIVEYAIYPGIFVALLVYGREKPSRGKAFGVVWIVIASVALLFSVVAIVQYQDTSISGLIMNAITPSYLKIAEWFRAFGSVCVIVSSVLFLTDRKSLEPTENEDNLQF